MFRYELDLELHELPNINMTNCDRLLVDAIINIVSGIFHIPRLDGICIEDAIVIANDSLMCLHQSLQRALMRF